jgi:cardiolipin synthase
VSARLGRSFASGGSTSRAAAGAIRLSHTFGAAITARRPVGPAEAFTLAYGALTLLGLAALGYFFPRALAVPFSVLMAWIGVSWLIRAWRLLAARRRENAAAQRETAGRPVNGGASPRSP